MAGFFTSLKRAFRGELLHRNDIQVDEGNVRVTMRLKCDRITRERYVVLGLVATTNYKHAQLSPREFQDLYDAMTTLKRALQVPEPLPPLKS
ncbi:MAG TPA: hypothetical protein VL101_08315 [Nordella sp.]|nr:hypothetical protein [Nordella sp.]